jgi:hypothetical protein
MLLADSLVCFETMSYLVSLSGFGSQKRVFGDQKHVLYECRKKSSRKKSPIW